MAKAKPQTAASPKSLALPISSLALGALIAELLGSFVMTFAILNTSGNAIVAAVALMILMLVTLKLSGGHINPLTTLGLLFTRQIGWKKALAYLIAQFAGAMLASVVATQFIASTTTMDPATGLAAPAKLFSVMVTGTWKPFFAEFIGALIFGFGVASAFIGKKENYEAAFTIGGAFLIGLIVATIGSNAVVNPAVALSVGAFNLTNAWGELDYAFAPAIGAIIGALLYQLLQSDIKLNVRKS
jgi:glycerol uptake facilitator-like aquaporin